MLDSKPRRASIRGTLAALLSMLCAASLPQTAARAQADVEMGRLSGALESPRRHFRLRNPAALQPGEAERMYRIAQLSLRAGYAQSNLDAARDYQDWRQYNSAPYLSATHGNHYINNFANALGAAYGRYEKAGRMPVGTVLAKDSFSVTRTGGILLGPLFIMEKMPAGFNYVTGDWKYIQVQPDGTLFGETGGSGNQRVEYCIACHLAVEHQDHLYFIPPAFRRP